MRNAIVIFFLIFCCIGFSGAQDLPSYSGYVNDYANVLDSQTKQQIELVSRDLKAKTGAELAVAIVDTTAPLDSKTYAVKLFEKWKIGEKGKDNGILFLLAAKDRRVEIEVGYGLEGILNDAKVGELLDTYVVPQFKQKQFSAGVLSGAQAIAKIIEDKGDGKSPATTVQMKPIDSSILIVFAVIGIIFIISLFVKGGSAHSFGALLGAIFGFVYMGSIVGAIIGAVLGFIFGISGFMFLGGGGFGGGGGGFGGFGGGGSGGGGGGRDF